MGVTYNSVSELRNSIVSRGVNTAWADKMLHQIPDLPIVKDRSAYLVEKAKDKIVLDIGCTGMISEAIRQSAKKYYGIDKLMVDGNTVLDIDHRPDQMPVHEDVEIVIVSEVLEHLANPGYFLLALRQKYPERVVYFTVPNAGSYKVNGDCEVVNRDHVSWYSYQTLLTLLRRYEYQVMEARWCNGLPYKAETIIMVVK